MILSLPDAFLDEVDRSLWSMCRDGFGVELVLAYPVLGDHLDLPIIAAAGRRDRVRVRPSQVFRHAIRRGATGVVVAHNHPIGSGPSEADLAVTRRLVSAGMVLDLPLLAHVLAEPTQVHELVSARSWPRRGAVERQAGSPVGFPVRNPPRHRAT